MFHKVLSLLFILVFMNSLSAESVEWTFYKSNIKGDKYDDGNPDSKAQFKKIPTIENNCLVLKGDNYLFTRDIS